MVCIQCNQEFNSKRLDAKYCSSVCRAKFNRTDTVKRTDNVTDKRTDNTKPDVTVKCPKTEHPQGCLQCFHIRKDNKDNTLVCNSQYYDCDTWGVCIDSYHRGMC